MKNTDLEQLLKSVQVPKRPEAYWREFPKTITTKLHWQGSNLRVETVKSRFRHAWSLALAAACVVIALVLKNRPVHSVADEHLAEARKCYHEFEALFPNQLRAIVFEPDGPRMMLADQPVVPESPPFYLKLCGPAGCEELVTFSGQQIRFNGEDCEVLADAQGQVMLVGDAHVWEESHPTDSVRIQATSLEAAL